MAYTTKELQIKDTSENLYFKMKDAQEMVDYTIALHDIIQSNIKEIRKLRNAYLRQEIFLGLLADITHYKYKFIPDGGTGVIFWLFNGIVMALAVAIILFLASRLYEIYPALGAIPFLFACIFIVVRSINGVKITKKTRNSDNPRVALVALLENLESYSKPEIESVNILGSREKSDGTYALRISDGELIIDSKLWDEFIGAGSPSTVYLVTNGIEILNKADKRVNPDEIFNSIRDIDKISKRILGRADI